MYTFSNVSTCLPGLLFNNQHNLIKSCWQPHQSQRCALHDTALLATASLKLLHCRRIITVSWVHSLRSGLNKGDVEIQLSYRLVWTADRKKKHSHRAVVQFTLLCAWCLQPMANRCTELQAGLNYSGAGGNYELTLVKMSVWLNCLKLSPGYFWLSALLCFLVMQSYFTSWLFISSLKNFQVSWFNQGQTCALTLWLGEQSAECRIIFYVRSIKTFLGQPDCTYYSSLVNFLPLLFCWVYPGPNKAT